VLQLRQTAQRGSGNQRQQKNIAVTEFMAKASVSNTVNGQGGSLYTNIKSIY